LLFEFCLKFINWIDVLIVRNHDIMGSSGEVVAHAVGHQKIQVHLSKRDTGNLIARKLHLA
jgi:hypothetical protein